MDPVQFKLLFVGLCTAISAAGDDAPTPGSEEEAQQVDNWRAYYEVLHDQLLAKYGGGSVPPSAPLNPTS